MTGRETKNDPGETRTGMTSGLLLAAAVTLLALPSAVLAFSTSFAPDTVEPAGDTQASSTGASGGAVKLARATPLRSLGGSLVTGQMFPFTPAKTPNRPDRSITVAVRVDPLVVRGIRSSQIAAAERNADAGSPSIKIAPTAFNLGVSRGYRNFGQALVPSSEARSDAPEMGRFTLSPGVRPDESRFAPRIVIDEKQTTGRAPRTFSGDREDRVDVGGSYRVTRNLDVTAGVRYSQDQRERLHPLTDGQKDSQAVYVGTQFRF